MGEVVSARTSPTLPRRPYIPHPLALCCHYPVSKCPSASIVVTSTVRVNFRSLYCVKASIWLSSIYHLCDPISTGVFVLVYWHYVLCVLQEEEKEVLPHHPSSHRWTITQRGNLIHHCHLKHFIFLQRHLIEHKGQELGSLVPVWKLVNTASHYGYKKSWITVTKTHRKGWIFSTEQKAGSYNTRTVSLCKVSLTVTWRIFLVWTESVLNFVQIPIWRDFENVHQITLYSCLHIEDLLQ